jgi:putative membrane protein insertion efficiency factor
MSAVHRAMWWLGAPARTVLIALIRVYRATLSGWLGGQCRFYPSCSHYAEDAIRVHGAMRGSAMTTWRVLRCNPFGRGGVDHVPLRGDGRSPHAYEGIILPATHPRETADATHGVTGGRR